MAEENNIEVVEFDQELYEKNLEENDFSPHMTYEGKDGKGGDKQWYYK